jgi:subtilisin family serine protease
MRLYLLLFLLFFSPLIQSGEFDLILGGRQFDPLAAPREQLDNSWYLNVSEEPAQDLRLIQLNGETLAGDMQMLRDAGFEPIQYIHPYTYVVWPNGASKQRRPLSSERVRWQGHFQPAYRVLPEHRTASGNAATEFVMAIYKGVDGDTIANALKGLGADSVRLFSSDHAFNFFSFSAPVARLNEMARLAGVYSIQTAGETIFRGEFSKQINRGLRDEGSGIASGYMQWLSEIGLDGSGVQVAIVDSGIFETNPDLAPAMVDCIDPLACGSGAQDNHGTHVAGIVGARNITGAVDSNGYIEAIGVAPGVTLIEIFSPLWSSIGISGVMELTVQNGAQISNNSWGTSGIAQGYDLNSRQVDVGVRDADSTTPGHQPLVYVQAIENGFGGDITIGAPEEAKNAVRVGSTRVRDLNRDLRTDNESISFNSAHGPGVDGRNIPDVVAPGCFVLSTGNATTNTMQCGTSMASPHIAGSAALFFEHYRNRTGQDPSPAMVKAALLTATQSLIGELDADDVVMNSLLDGRQGYGMLVTSDLVQTQTPVLKYDAPVVFTQTGEDWQQTLEVIDPMQPVRIMLVWTDAPGHGLGGATPALNNNLDLVVAVKDTDYLGNVFDGNGDSVPGGNADTLNNTEGIFFPAGFVEDFEVRVSATNIAWDAIPDNGIMTDQDFALVCFNCAPKPGIAYLSTAESGELCRNQSIQREVQLEPVNGFSGDVELVALNVPDGIQIIFDPVSAPIEDLRGFTITADNTVLAGNYSIQIRAFSAIGAEAFSNVELRVSEALPATPILLSPIANSTTVGFLPQFVWQSEPENRFEVQLLDALDQVLATYPVASGFSFELPDRLQPYTTYGWRVVAQNACGDSTLGEIRKFRTRFQAPILLVDDDDNAPDVRAYYTDAMADLGWRYDVWDTQNSAVEPQASDLEGYAWVIWFSGNAFTVNANKAGPNVEIIPIIDQYLSDGGNLWMISPNLFARSQFLANPTFTGFLENTLGVAEGVEFSGQDQIFGTLGSVFADQAYTLQHIYTDRSDSVSPAAEAKLMFAGNLGNAGIFKETEAYKAAYWSFPFEAIPAEQQRDVMALMGQFLNITHPEGCFGPQDVTQSAAQIWVSQSQAIFDLINCVDSYGLTQ